MGWAAPSSPHTALHRAACFPLHSCPKERLSVPSFPHSEVRMQLENPLLTKKQANDASIGFTFILIGHSGSKCAFLLGSAIRATRAVKEPSPVLFSGSVNSRMCLWVPSYYSISGTAVSLSLLIYRLSRTSFSTLKVWTSFQLLSKTEEVFSSSHWLAGSLSRSQAFRCFVWARRKTLIVPIF